MNLYQLSFIVFLIASACRYLMSDPTLKKCAREQIMQQLRHFPEGCLGKEVLQHMQAGKALNYTEMKVLMNLCEGMNLKVFSAFLISHRTYWFVSSASKHNEKLTEMYQGKGVYYPIEGLIALGEISVSSHSATHLFDEEIILNKYKENKA